MLDYLWRWFTMLNGCREVGFGIGPISHQEILAWGMLYRFRPSPAEVTVLRAIDSEFCEHHNKKAGSAGDRKVELSSREITPELFDVLFK